MHMDVDLGSSEFWERIQKEPARLAAQVAFIDVHKIDETMQRHPALRAWVNSVHETARIEEEKLKWRLTVARARAFLESSGPVEERKAKADTHESVLAATELLFAAQEKRGALRAMADALEDRVQMLIQIAAKLRQESRDYSR